MTSTRFPIRMLSLSLIAGLALLPLGCGKEAAEAAEEEKHEAPVKWEPLEKADVEEWIELLGTTEPLPNHSARVSAAVEGHVLEVLPSKGGKAIVEGQRVEAGQILVRLDDRIPRANRAKLKAGDADLKEQIIQAENVVALAQINLDSLEKLRATRTAGLGSLPLVNDIDLEKARVALKDAKSKHKAVKAKEEIARADVKIVDEQLSLYTLTTPIAGQLGIVHAVPGQTLAVGAVIAEVIDLDEIDVLCYVPARTVAHLKLGQEVRIEDAVEASSDAAKEEKGRIVFIAEQAQAETGAIAVKARFPNHHRKLRANTIVRASVLKEKKHDCLSIPVAALLEDLEEPAVLLVEKEEKKESDKKENEKKEDEKKEDEKKADDKKEGEKKEGEKEEEKYHVRKLLVKLGLRGKERVELLGLIDPKDKKPVPLEKGMLFVTEGGHGLEDGDLVKEKEEEHKEDEKKDEHKEGEKKEEK